jgi:hypothetical protein
VLLYIAEAARELIRFAVGHWHPKLLRELHGDVLSAVLRLRGTFLGDTLRPRHSDIIVCESGLDEGVFLEKRIARLQVLDLPSPFVDELYYGGEISERARSRLHCLERYCFETADKISFHWPSYQEYVQEKIYDGPNWFSCTYGVERKTKRARFSTTPKVIFLGNLGGYWVNIPLLEELCKIYPAIDVWGGPRPGRRSGLNYRGYAPTLDVMANYQFGLITITTDPLRTRGFSSKHLEYASYGLPVLTPEWQRDELLDPSSIKFTAETFLSMLAHYSVKERWLQKSEQSLALADGLGWESAFSEFGAVLDEWV